MARNQEKAQTMLNRCVAPRMMQGWQPLTTAATATDLATIEPGSHSTHAARDWCLSQQLLQRKMHPVHPGNLSAKHLRSNNVMAQVPVWESGGETGAATEAAVSGIRMP
jgi:hypothetical protein